ncbi:MAG: UDP-2,3-diacylglucosamine diphosphatase [Patescibacteria group bacterium]|nr:UDP-2,3-diacylglucosamine diphosphatase [Patescibacteria group bacterium]
MLKTNTIIISDVHLGTSVSRAKKLLEIMQKWRVKRLILLGDIFDDLNFGNLIKEHWDLLAHFRRISTKTEVVWVEGNHDKGLSKVMSAFLNIKVYKVYTWKYRKQKYLAIHGHQFDRFLKENLLISLFSSYIYLGIQKIDFKDRRISRAIKKKSKGWLRLSQKVAKSAAWYGRLRGAKYVFCGHTHLSTKKRFGNIIYYNSGCWTDIPSTFITIDKDIKINKVK